MPALFALPIHLILLPVCLTAADDRSADPGTPSEQYAALLSEYRPASGGLRGAGTDLERKEAVERMGAFAPRFLELAATYPEDPIALDALKQAIQIALSADSAALTTWEMNSSEFPAGSDGELAGRTVSVLIRDHLQSAQLGPICDRLRYAYRLEYGEFLRTVLRENPHRGVQGLACIALAQYLSDRLRMLSRAEDRPELSRHYATLFGEDYLPEILRSVRVEEIEALFARAVEEFADVRLVFGGTVGAKATAELYELRHLSIGMTAPEIAGVDQDGESFRLSDYRGKVVLIYFWMEI